MTVRSYFRGHEVISEGEYWVYLDTGEKAGFGHKIRPCKKCGKIFEGSNNGEADLCLGDLPGVDNACCGHGVHTDSYVRFTSGRVLTDFTIER